MLNLAISSMIFGVSSNIFCVHSIMANLASPIPMMDPNTNNDSGYAPSNLDVDKEHTPPASPTTKEEKKDDKTDAPKKPELK